MGRKEVQGKGLDLTESLTVYGFGSYFSGAAAPNDIDLLIVHQSGLKPSCAFAVLCKSVILNELTKAHVTMLSVREANEHDFIARARAIRLQEIHEASIAADISGLLCLIESYYKRPLSDPEGNYRDTCNRP